MNKLKVPVIYSLPNLQIIALSRDPEACPVLSPIENLR